LIVCEVPITAPAAFSACAATYDSPLGATRVVSNPSFGALATAVRCVDDGPPYKRQLATSVAPFQLAYTVTGALELGALGALATTDGGLAGVPVQVNRYARYDS